MERLRLQVFFFESAALSPQIEASNFARTMAAKPDTVFASSQQLLSGGVRATSVQLDAIVIPITMVRIYGVLQLVARMSTF